MDFSSDSSTSTTRSSSGHGVRVRYSGLLPEFATVGSGELVT